MPDPIDLMTGGWFSLDAEAVDTTRLLSDGWFSGVTAAAEEEEPENPVGNPGTPGPAVGVPTRVSVFGTIGIF